ncbi:MAG: hypothetical protein WC998_03575 [Candidatus Paceibacterota bacterium]|jgi:hypothetical protein
MEKRGYFVIGLIFIGLSLVIICSYLTTEKALTTATISMIIGVAGIISLYLSEKINEEISTLSVIMLIFGGLLIPLSSLPKEHSLSLTALLYLVAILLPILGPPQKTNKEASVQ